MRKPLWVAVAILLLGVGCPLEFGKGGIIDEAMADDTKAMVDDMKVCPAGTHRQQPKAPCTDPSCEPGCVADTDAGLPSSPP